MKIFVVSFVLLSAIFSGITEAKQFNECSLAKTMHNLGVPKNELADWVCLAKHESNFKTNAMNKKNGNGSWDWGIFQINDKYWCQRPGSGFKSSNACKKSCNDIVSDNISAAVQCARVIKKQQGFKAWVAWNKYCQKNKPNINKCF